MFGLIKKNRPLTYAAIAVPVSLLIAFGLLRFQENSRLTNANKIINAVEAYKTVHQHYPDSLSQLVPGQLTTIPKNYFGFMWRNYVYHKTGNNFDLKVETGKSTGMVWLSSEYDWDNYD
ncbi:type II secretion system GspH family protein [Mucilaginibacter humi]|uniref:type II secretion system GspH family protein n=1 Tax=Mucilaginibacter humi TaxID=2732510 RepID=UPI001C2E41CD|nr:type II secretion system GspH family protein [Mucilaginibacter humi]